MSIEKDINQTKPFISEYHKAIINIQFTHSWVVGHLKSVMAEYDITPHQYNILRILRGSKNPISILNIKERMLDQQSDASRLVERLVIKGLVHKHISQKDRRLVDITISDEGLRLLQTADSLNDDLLKIFSNITVKEAEKLNNLLDKFRDSQD